MRTISQTYVDRQAVLTTVTSVFTTSDRRDWEACLKLFAKEVILDYQSFSGEPSESLSPKQIVERWRNVLPGFASTQHMLSNYGVEFFSLNLALCRFYGYALHYLPGASGEEEWGVYRTYTVD